MPWFIDTIEERPGHYYRYRVTGLNTEVAAGPEHYSWRVPDIADERFQAGKHASLQTAQAIDAAKARGVK